MIVIGAEDKGVRRPVARACKFVARLPMRGPVASLNASVAGALALYEILRQRQIREKGGAQAASAAADPEGSTGGVG
jgi:23S rRNA (guanosine2251-2'-O)-methyltransferase